MNFLNYLATIAIIIVVDLPWLMLGSKTSKAMILSIQGSELTIRWFAALVVYFALAYLAHLPKDNTEAFLLGLCIYAVYDFTNYSTLKNYSLKFAVMDSLWGGVLFVIVFNILKWLKLDK
jgi:uncharacterized membrane protein